MTQPHKRDPQPKSSVMESAPAPRAMIDGRDCLYFAGTGYLGLQAHPELIAAAQQACAEFGVHTATTRTGYGSSPPVLEVERRAAEFLAAEEACYLVSGYAVNFAIAAALSGQTRLALIDESAHDCLRESTTWLSSLKHPPLAFRHRDADHLADLLAVNIEPSDRPLVLTDGIFAASGQLAPLGDYLAVLDRYPGAMMLVDDAHGTAVVGASGRGSLELAGVSTDRINTHESPNGATAIYLGTTLSKAVGGHGGAIVGTREFLAQVRQASGWFRGASAPAAPVAAATAKGLEIVQREPQLRALLAENVQYLRRRLRGLGLDVANTPAAIVSFRLETTAKMQRVREQLLAVGIAIAFTQNYAGAGPDGMLRVAVFATHTPAMMDQLVDQLGRVL